MDEINKLREALEHAREVLYRIGNERRTDDGHKINAHVESVRISRVLHGLSPEAAQQTLSELGGE